MSGYRGGRAPSFSGKGGGSRISSLQAHDVEGGGDRGGGRGGGGGRGRGRGGKRVLNGNFMNRDRGGAGSAAAEETNAKVRSQNSSNDF